jgi:short subunit dehydrogenase-like uncharacterized protein
MNDWLLYGATGYTGSLIARMAAERGMRPILAGRDAAKLAGVVPGLPTRAFGLDAIDLGGVALVLHCAGPFSATSRQMADACLARGVHYLDITGEIGVFEALARRSAESRAAGVMLMPGVGFDVVPSDCLAAYLHRRLPTATHLRLAFQSFGRLSRGTAKTMAENLPHGGAVRRGGRIVRVPACWRTRTIDIGAGPVVCMTIPWGDVSTAYHTTGIGNIETYLAAPPPMRLLARLSRPFTSWLGSRWVQDWLKRRIESGPPGPSEEGRARGKMLLWGEVTDDRGAKAVARLRGPEGYTWTALTALAVVERVLAGDVQPGFQTPGGLYGPDFVLGPGVERKDG